MKPQSLQEMDDSAFLAKVDVLMEHLERQVDGNSLGEWTVSAIKSENRRRILTARDEKKIGLTHPCLSVDVIPLDISDFAPHLLFEGLPLLIYINGQYISDKGEVLDRVVKRGYFSIAEAQSYLEGVKAVAKHFGINVLNKIPDISDLEVLRNTPRKKFP